MCSIKFHSNDICCWRCKGDHWSPLHHVIKLQLYYSWYIRKSEHEGVTCERVRRCARSTGSWRTAPAPARCAAGTPWRRAAAESTRSDVRRTSPERRPASTVPASTSSRAATTTVHFRRRSRDRSIAPWRHRLLRHRQPPRRCTQNRIQTY